MRKLFSEEEIEWLRNNHSKYSLEDLAKEFNLHFSSSRRYDTITHKCRKLGLFTNVEYTKEEEQWLIDNFHNFKGYKDLTDSFNKTFSRNKTSLGLQGKCQRLGLQFVYPHTKEEEQWLIENFDNYNCLRDVLAGFNEHFEFKRDYEWLLRIVKVLKLRMNKKRLYNQEQKDWLTKYSKIYGEKELAIEYNKKFHTNKQYHSLGRFVRETLNIRFTDSDGNYLDRLKEINEYPIGSERIGSDGRVWVKVKDDFKSRDNWKLKARVISNAKDNDFVYLLDPNKPVTKDNILVVDRKYQNNLNIVHFNDLVPELKPLAIKIAKLKYLQQHYKD